MVSIEQLTKDYIHKVITKPFNFRNVDINDWNASKTVWKELTGFLTLTKLLGPLDWVEDKVLQKQGVDFIYKGKNHDLKALVGDYHTEEGLNVTIELKQYSKSSFDDKITDVLVYTILEETGISIVFIDFKKLKDWIISKSTNYQLRTSNNGTGEYVKVPVRDLKDFSVVRSLTI